MTLLELKAVSRQFGKLQALEDVSFQMPEGQLRAVIGPNGAGKSTVLCALNIFFARLKKLPQT